MLKKLLISVIAIALVNCSSTAPQLNATAVEDRPREIKTTYSELAKTGGTLFTLDSKKSTVRIYVFRSGILASKGHNHVLAAPRFNGYFFMPSSDSLHIGRARFDLEFRLDELEMDNPDIRASLGTAFAGKLSSDAINSTREHMLGEDNFQANRYPFVRIHSLQLVGEAPKFAAKIQINLHGQSREMWVPLNVDGLPKHLLVTGSFVLAQTDFGVSPFSAMAGMLSVQDEVVVEFQLTGVPQVAGLAAARVDLSLSR